MTINYPYWNNDEVISSDKLNSMVQAIINGDPLAVKVSNTTKNDVNQIISYLSSLYNSAKTNLNSATSTSDLDTAYTNMTALVSNKLGSYANDDTVDLYSTGIRASIITFLQAYDSMMSNDRLNNKNTDNTLSSRIDSEAQARSDADTSINNSLNEIKANGGGRNLAIDTSSNWTTAPDVDQYNITTIATYANAQAGDTFTVSVDTQSTKTLAWQIWQGSSQYIRSEYVTGGDNWLITSGTTHSHTTFTWPSGATQYLIVQLICSTSDASHASYQYKNVMLEKGSVAHDWQPAPEDVDTNTDAKINAVTNNVGGRNLVSGTGSEYTMRLVGVHNTTWEDGYACSKLPLTLTDSGIEILPHQPTFYYTLTQGTTYTQTVWLETDATVKDLSAETNVWRKPRITWFTIGSEHDWQPTRVQKLGQNCYKVVSTYTWPGKSDNNVRLFDITGLDYAFDLSTGTYLKFGKLKFEEGVVSTAWQPAPEDIEANIDAKFNGIANNGGGRNLVANTGTDIVVDDTSNTGTSGYMSVPFDLTEQLKKGDTITVSAEGTVTGTGDISAYSVLLYDFTRNVGISNMPQLKPGQRDCAQITVSQWVDGNTNQLIIYAGKRGDTQGKKNIIHHLMVEKGMVAHDWQPAPEDFDNYTPGRIIKLPHNSSITVNDDRIIPKIQLPTYFTDYTASPYLNNLATIGECDNLFIPSSKLANLNNLPTNPDTGSALTGDCFFTNHYAYSGTTVRAFQKLYSCDYNYVFIRSYNGSSVSWSNWSCLTPYA